MTELFNKFRYYEKSDLGLLLPFEINTEIGNLLFSSIDSKELLSAFIVFDRDIREMAGEYDTRLYWDDSKTFNELIILLENYKNKEYLEHTIDVLYDLLITNDLSLYLEGEDIDDINIIGGILKLAKLVENDSNLIKKMLSIMNDINDDQLDYWEFDELSEDMKQVYIDFRKYLE